MSLLKQVSIVLGFIFLILFVSIIGLSFNIIKDSSAKSLYENVQNSVTSTSLSITNAGVDEGTIKTVINAAFDNGNYEKIVFKNINDEIVYELKKDLIISDEIPHWFINIVDTGEISALASISEGWNVLGVLDIYADRAIYYNETYSMFIKLLQSLAFSFVVLIIILSIFFNFILKPLRTINNQAKAVMNNEFILSTEQPFTDEFKTLTTSINSMVSKFEKMFQNTNEVLKINNRKYFILKANEYLDKDSSNNKGFIVSLSIKLDVINKTYGFIKTNEILFKLASNLKNSFNSDKDSVVRMNGSEFLALVPNAKEEDVKNALEKLIIDLKAIVELEANIFIGRCKYENEESLRTLFTKIDYTLSQAKVNSDKDYFYVTHMDNIKTKEEWINILNVSLKEEFFRLIHRDIVDINSKEEYLKTISFELDFKGETIRYGEFIASVLEQNRLDEVYLHVIEKVFKQNKANEFVSIQLPTLFIEKLSSYSNLKDLLNKYKHISKNIIFEIEEEAFNKNFNSTLMYISLFKEFGFNFAIFNFIANSDDYNYLKELRPLYIKASKFFLLESRQSLNMLKILT